jgi:transcriptional regulator with XRE-family HTH domain
MSIHNEYACDMKSTREKIAEATKRLIGEGKPFRSARDLAQRAHTLGYIDSVESFARAVSRLRNGDHDPQIGTVEIVARAAGVNLTDFLDGRTQPEENVNSPNKANELPLSGQSEGDRRAILIAESLTHVSQEMRELIEHLIDLDRIGGAEREMAVAGIRYILRGSLAVMTSSKKT